MQEAPSAVEEILVHLTDEPVLDRVWDRPLDSAVDAAAGAARGCCNSDSGPIHYPQKPLGRPEGWVDSQRPMRTVLHMDAVASDKSAAEPKPSQNVPPLRRPRSAQTSAGSCSTCSWRELRKSDSDTALVLVLILLVLAAAGLHGRRVGGAHGSRCC